MDPSPDELGSLAVDDIDDKGAFFKLLDPEWAEFAVAEIGFSSERGGADAKIGDFSFCFGDRAESDSEIGRPAIASETFGMECCFDCRLNSAVDNRTEGQFLVVGACLAIINGKASIVCHCGHRAAIVVDLRRGNAARKEDKGGCCEGGE